jgi:hypothetical protein
VLKLTAPAHGQETGNLRIEVLATYGWADVSAEQRSTMSEGERRLEGGVLGNPTDVQVGADGAVYVLDAYYKKVVVFEPSGELRTAFGGEGEGPGEMMRPHAMSLDGDGSILVYDRSLARVTRYDGSGEHLGSFAVRVATPISMAHESGRLWMSRMVSSPGDRPVVALDAGSGEVGEGLFELSREEFDLAHGFPGVLARRADVGVTLCGPAPGTWRTWSDGQVTRHGENRWPRARAERRASSDAPAVVLLPLNLFGCAALSDGAMVMTYAERSEPGRGGGRPVNEFWIELAGADGVVLGRGRPPDGMMARQAVAVGTREVLAVIAGGMIPHVARLRLSVE